MRRVNVLLAFVLMFVVGVVFTSCGNSAEKQTEVASTQEVAESTSEAEVTENVSEPDTKEYIEPEDRTFSVMGTDLREYTFIAYFPNEIAAGIQNRGNISRFREDLEGLANKTLGFDIDYKCAKNDNYFEKKKSEHEVLFGDGFKREGIPEADKNKSFYGVTEDGTIYFSSPSLVMYPYMWQLFMEEFMGVPVDSGLESYGCNITEPVYREVPDFNYEELEEEGYKLVFEDNFDGNDLDWNVWKIRGEGVTDREYVSASQVSVSDGILKITSEYKEDGENGAGWYTANVSLQKWYRQGYFEAQIKCPSYTTARGGTPSAAFWIQGPFPYDPEKSKGGAGEGGCEIDIMENFGNDFYSYGLFCSGANDVGELDSYRCEMYGLGNDYSAEYVTYALKWDENCYEFYKNGMLVARTDFAYGTSSVEEEVIFDFSIPKMEENTPLTNEMCIDYIRIWQKSE